MLQLAEFPHAEGVLRSQEKAAEEPCDWRDPINGYCKQ